MPEIKNYKYRRWCKNCKDFKIHNKTDNDIFVCSCGTEYTSVKIKEIPNKKIIEQRE